jgi:hypothetical protein
VFGKFDYEEACHGAVCIEIAPGEVEVVRWHEAAPPDDRLAALPVAYLAYSSLGAAHINQVLRNMFGKGGSVGMSCGNGRFRALEPSVGGGS